MKQFPTAANFSSWSGLAPGNNQSAGKRKRAPAMKGNPHIKTAVVEAPWSASRTRQSEFEDRYQRLKPRIGHKRAIVASAHTLALRIYEVLGSGTPYQPHGANLTPRSDVSIGGGQGNDQGEMRDCFQNNNAGNFAGYA